MVADLSRATKTCQCGHKIDLAKVARIAESASADDSGEMLRQITARKNSGFTSAEQLASFSAADTLRKENR